MFTANHVCHIIGIMEYNHYHGCIVILIRLVRGWLAQWPPHPRSQAPCIAGLQGQLLCHCTRLLAPSDILNYRRYRNELIYLSVCVQFGGNPSIGASWKIGEILKKYLMLLSITLIGLLKQCDDGLYQLFLWPHVMRRHIVYCMFFSRRQQNRQSLVADISDRCRRNWTKFCSYLEERWCTHHPDRWALAQVVLLESQNIEGCKKIVTLFSKVVSPISMKFGMMGALVGSMS